MESYKKRFSFRFYETPLYLEEWMILWPFADTHWDQFQPLGASKHSVLEKHNPKEGLAFIGPLQSALNALLRVL